MISGCTKKEATPPSQLNIHFPLVSLNLDPHKMEDAYSMTVVLQVHRGLLRYTPSGDVAPDLAKKWADSPNHKTYTFKLNESHFSDGSPVTAKNVRMSFARLFYSGAAMGADLDYIDGAAEFKKTGDIEKLGIRESSPNEIVFHLSHPSALFLKHLAVADCAILSLTDFKQELAFGANTPYTGPYKVISVDKEKGVTLEKWRDDVLQAKNPPKIIKFFLSGEAPVDLAFRGETDSLDHDPVPDDEIKKLRSKGWQETATELIGESYLIMNPKRISKEIRQAIFSAVDQREVARILGAKFSPAYGAIPRGLPGELQEQDIAELRSARKAKGTVNLQFDPQSLMFSKVVSYLKGRLESAGLTVNLIPLEKRELLTKIFSSDCEMCLGSKGLDYPDGFSVLTYFKSGSANNYFYVKDAGVDALLTEAGKILEKDVREASYKEIQKKILSQYTLVPLAFGSMASGLWSGKIENVPPHVMGYHMLPFETIEMKQQ